MDKVKQVLLFSLLIFQSHIISSQGDDKNYQSLVPIVSWCGVAISIITLYQMRRLNRLTSAHTKLVGRLITVCKGDKNKEQQVRDLLSNKYEQSAFLNGLSSSDKEVLLQVLQA